MNKIISAADVPGFDRLTAREQAFVQHPLVYTDPRKAALESGYSSVVAQCKSYAMRQKLMSFIQPRFIAQMARLEVDRSRVEEELAVIAFVDVSDFQERVDLEMADGGFQTVTVWKDPMLLPAHMRRAIKSVEWGTEQTADGGTIFSDRPTDVIFHSKEKALHELAGLFSDVAPKSPGDEEQNLLDNLNPVERAQVIKYYTLAARRAADKSKPPEAEGTHVEPLPVRRIEAPVARRSETPRDDRRRSESARDQPPDAPLPPRSRRVRVPAPVSEPGSSGGEDSDSGYLDLPD